MLRYVSAGLFSALLLSSCQMSTLSNPKKADLSPKMELLGTVDLQVNGDEGVSSSSLTPMSGITLTAINSRSFDTSNRRYISTLYKLNSLDSEYLMKIDNINLIALFKPGNILDSAVVSIKNKYGKDVEIDRAESIIPTPGMKTESTIDMDNLNFQVFTTDEAELLDQVLNKAPAIVRSSNYNPDDPNCPQMPQCDNNPDNPDDPNCPQMPQCDNNPDDPNDDYNNRLTVFPYGFSTFKVQGSTTSSTPGRTLSRGVYVYVNFWMPLKKNAYGFVDVQKTPSTGNFSFLIVSDTTSRVTQSLPEQALSHQSLMGKIKNQKATFLTVLPGSSFYNPLGGSGNYKDSSTGNTEIISVCKVALSKGSRHTTPSYLINKC